MIAPLAASDVAVQAFERERQQAAEERDIHIATCRPRRQGLACAHCYRVAARLDQAVARLERAERRHKAAIATQQALDEGIAWA
jgi:hypothetical protein